MIRKERKGRRRNRRKKTIYFSVYRHSITSKGRRRHEVDDGGVEGKGG